MPVCPTPGKQTFKSKGEAMIRAKYGKFIRGRKAQLRPYECVCGYWHLTSMSKREVKLLKKRRATA